jgi:lipoprotein-anchoring transpeptidase ErfK/SrfK
MSKKPSLEKQSVMSLIILLCIIFFVMDDEASPNVSAQELGPTPAFPTIVENLDVPLAASPALSVSEGKYEYVTITQGCTHGTQNCIVARSGPGNEYDTVYELEKGMLLRVTDTVERNGQTWYKVYFDEWLRYPTRTQKTWYVPASAGELIRADGVEELKGTVATDKRIVVDLSDHMLTAYDGDKLFFSTVVATGEDLTPTPTGTFSIYKKTPTRYMQGPLPGVTDIPFDLPGVPWDMYFTQGGAAIHGTYWHDNYGSAQSDGCINVPVELAKLLYAWADVGTPVIIKK